MSATRAIGEAWGGRIGAYFTRAVGPDQLILAGRANLPAGSRIWASWHGNNLVALRFHALTFDTPSHSFVPPGFVGDVARGLVHGVGGRTVEPRLDRRASAAAMKAMARVLQEGGDACIAVDGPAGPSHRVRPGALWLARLTGTPVIPTGIAVRPALRFPRWDRALVPVRTARIVAVVAEPLVVDTRQVIDETLLAALGRRLDDATDEAWAILNRGPQQKENVA